jgi:hypothetical protein
MEEIDIECAICKIAYMAHIIETGDIEPKFCPYECFMEYLNKNKK